MGHNRLHFDVNLPYFEFSTPLWSWGYYECFFDMLLLFLKIFSNKYLNCVRNHLVLFFEVRSYFCLIFGENLSYFPKFHVDILVISHETRGHKSRNRKIFQCNSSQKYQIRRFKMKIFSNCNFWPFVTWLLVFVP